MTRLGETFEGLRARGERALVAYLTAGDPSLADTRKLVLEAARRGADVVAVDVAPTLVRLARERAPREVAGRVEFVVGDMLEELSPADTYLRGSVLEEREGFDAARDAYASADARLYSEDVRRALDAVLSHVIDVVRSGECGKVLLNWADR